MRADNTCDYLIVSCMDFRIQRHVHAWAEQHLGGKLYDYVACAGGTKDLDVIISQVDIAADVHGIKQVYLIHHEDCRAYGELGTLERHTADLQKAKHVILGKYPDLLVDTFYLKLNGEISPTA